MQKLLPSRSGPVLTSASLDVSRRQWRIPFRYPVFISFEGIDGSGKSTQARLLAESLRERGLDVVLVREPGGTRLGETVRGLLLATDSVIDPRAELLLFSAARAQLVEHVIRPALAKGTIVIADRYIDSSTAYQGGGRGIGDVGWFQHYHEFVTSGLWPDRTYLLQIDLSIARQRRRSAESDRMEAGGSLFYERVQGFYKQIADASPDRILELSGDRTVEDLHRTILTDYNAYS